MEISDTTVTRKLHSFSIRNDVFRDYLYSKGVPKHIIYFEDDNLDESYKTAVRIFEYADNQNLDLEILAKNFKTENRVVILENEVVVNQDLNLPREVTYAKKGSDGNEIYSEQIKYSINNQINREVINSVQISSEEPVNDQKYEGILSSADFTENQKSIIQSQFPIEEISLHDVVWDEEIFYDQEKIKLGTAKILFDRCSYYFLSDIHYSPAEGNFEYEQIENLSQFDCENEILYPEPVEIATCGDCLLFPVDKKHRLPEDYVPEVVDLTEFGSSYELSNDSIEDFRMLWKAIVAQGFNPNITSGYRSYQNQVETFQYWVDFQITIYGYSPAEAELRANTISAKPGFSEHQLGTTIDLNAVECEDFSGTCPFNEEMWEWLDANSYRYGFIRSYPDGKEVETGYIPEPWHFRWLGKEIAKEYFSQRDSVTLNQFLDRRRFE